MTSKSAKELVAEANRTVETLTAQDAASLIGRSDVLLVDVREGEEVQRTGKLRGALHVPRGFLEFQADPASPSHKPELASGKRLVLYCASGNRSALAAKSLNEMGVPRVSHVAGGFAALKEAGADIEQG